MTHIVLNMIVKNEAARIERCLRSVLSYVQWATIMDTGSTDETRDIVVRLCDEAGVPLTLLQSGFQDFSQSRNEALSGARLSVPSDSYILLMDADMELVAKPGWADNLTAPAYRMNQTHGIVYGNTRLIRADAPAFYKGRTHEVLHVEGAVQLDTAHFIDHADGANRPGKLERDIALLQQDMEDDPADPRPVFYLANSHRDLGLHGVAAQMYDRRASMGGWDEEVFVSKLYAGRCYLANGQEAIGVQKLLEAHALRPSRAEAMASLARHYRLKPDQQAVGLMYAREGMSTPPTSDILFVESAAWDYELKRDFAICGFYSLDPEIKRSAFKACDELATSRSVPADVRQEARNNLYWFTPSLEETFPGARRVRIEFPNPEGWWAMNASILMHGGKILLLQRVCNFKVDKITGAYSMPNGITRTRNFLCELNQTDFSITKMTELHIHPEPPIYFEWVQGFEDMRLFPDELGRLWVSATTRQLDPEGLCEIVCGMIDGSAVTPWRIVSNRHERRNEKNWAPIIDKPFAWMYLHDPDTIIKRDDTRIVVTPPFAIDHFRGSSQVILDGENGRHIWTEHEVVEAWGPRKYLHRFVVSESDTVGAFTLPFHFAPLATNGNQFTCGLTDDGVGNFLVPYSLNDEESWLVVIPKTDVYKALER